MGDLFELVLKTYESEKQFWGLLAEPVKKNGLLYYQSDWSTLNEARKLVVEKRVKKDKLEKALNQIWVKRLVFPPCKTDSQYAGHLLGGACGNVLLVPDGNACLYMIAENQISKTIPPDGFTMRKMDNTNEDDHRRIRQLRCKKDSRIADGQVRAELLKWTEDRINYLEGYQTWMLFKGNDAVGCLSAIRSNDLTRIRDFFILPEQQGNNLSKHLLSGVMNELKPPFAVVTDTNNTARFSYLGRGFEPVFIQQAYKVLR